MTNVREKFLQDHADMARRAFETHQIREESSGRWLLMKPSENGEGWRSEYWTEIIVTHGGGLYVDGDIDCVVFRYGPKHPLARLAWMAQRKSAWDHYFREKASIGMGGKGNGDLLIRFESDVAAYDLREHITTLTEEDKDEMDSGNSALVDELASVLALAEQGCNHEEMVQALGDAGHDLWELASYIGIVPSTRMFSAHAALQRLHHLLVERGDYAEAPSRD